MACWAVVGGGTVLADTCSHYSFTYNVGVENLAVSTLLKLLNQGDVAGAAQQFKLWDHVGGVVLPGLVKRRQAETNLFLLPVA